MAVKERMVDIVKGTTSPTMRVATEGVSIGLAGENLMAALNSGAPEDAVKAATAASVGILFWGAQKGVSAILERREAKK